ncbi:response regulator transcription factor [Vibrio sp. 10N.261.46.E11]|uniref:response regulator transcription factor n=1 Tax=Vibrio sp. 10N.261.46.E11 TaxID=3229662 RepID=UPI003552BA0F
MKNTVLVIEDDLVISDLIKEYISEEGFLVYTVYDGLGAIEAITRLKPDVVLLDLMLPGVNGAVICQEARIFYKGPLIILTASVEQSSEVMLLKYGADDYITKPFKGEVLLARIDAIIRRLDRRLDRRLSDSTTTSQVQIDTYSKRIFLGTTEIIVTKSEFDVFEVLYNSIGNIVSRERCSRSLRGIAYSNHDRTIDMRISGLRKKLRTQEIVNLEIRAIRNQGYVLIEK